jgi:dienelactone hydrolase
MDPDTPERTVALERAPAGRPPDEVRAVGAREATPLYLDVGGERAFAVYHPPAPGSRRDCAIVICPPFGWDEVAAHRGLREWADRLAAAGHPTLRLSYPGTGDSDGSARDPGRLDAWGHAVAGAAAWLRAQTGAGAVVALGLSLGGVVAYRALSAGAPLDGLILWSTPDRGRDLVRQLRTFSRLERAESFKDLEPPPPLPDGELEAGGFLLSGETVAALEALDLSTLPSPAALPLGALLLERDGIAMGAGLKATLEGGGIPATSDPGAGYADLTSHPQESDLPEEVMARVQAWLAERSQPCADPVIAADDRPHAALGAPADTAPVAHRSLHYEVGGTAVTETPIEISQPFGRMRGVLVAPVGETAGFAAVFLNAGAISRAGPNRMWVRTARRWAARGVPSLRLDIEGIGEADGPLTPYRRTADLYSTRLVVQIRAALDWLHASGVADRAVLIGMCSGAYWAFHTALIDDRVTSTLMLNPRVVIWDEGLSPARDMRHASYRSLVHLGRAETRARLYGVVRWFLRRTWRRMTSAVTRTEPRNSLEVEVEAALGQLRASGKRTLFLFAANEPLEQDLIRAGLISELADWPSLTVDRIAVDSHTLRPHWAQAQANDSLDRALERELAAGG